MDNGDLEKLLSIRAMMSECIVLSDEIKNHEDLISNNEYKKKQSLDNEKKKINDLKKLCNEEILVLDKQDYVNQQMEIRKKGNKKNHINYVEEQKISSSTYTPYIKNELEFDFVKVLSIIEIISTIISILFAIVFSFVSFKLDFWVNTSYFKWLFSVNDPEKYDNLFWGLFLGNSIYNPIIFILVFIIYVIFNIVSFIIIIDLLTFFLYSLFLLILMIFNIFITKFNNKKNLKRYNKELDKLKLEEKNRVLEMNNKIRSENEKIDIFNAEIDAYNDKLRGKIEKEYNKYLDKINEKIEEKDKYSLKLQELKESYSIFIKQVSKKYNEINSTHLGMIKINQMQLNEVAIELENFCDGFIDLSDLKNIDYLIYYISTHRASNIKEALNLLDNELRLSLTLEAINNMNKQISAQIQKYVCSTISYMNSSFKMINDNMKILNDNIIMTNDNMDNIGKRIDENNNNLMQSLLKLQGNINEKIQYVLNENIKTKQLVCNNISLVSALQEQLSTSSEEMTKRLKKINNQIFFHL